MEYVRGLTHCEGTAPTLPIRLLGYLLRELNFGCAVFGTVHRGIRTFDQLAWRGAMLREQGNSDTRANTQASHNISDTDLARYLYRFDYFFCQGAQILLIAGFQQQAEKLIAPMSASGVVGSNAFPEALGDSL